MEGSVQGRRRYGCMYAAWMVVCIGLCVVRVCEGAAADMSGCPTALTKLLSCLPYSQGTAQVPTKDCCTNLETVHETEPQCLCALIAGSVNGTQGLPKVNTTLALQLGPACKVATKPSVCPGLLGLSPSDPLNHIFTSGSSTSSSNLNTTTSPATQVSSGSAMTGSTAPPSDNAASPLYFSLTASFLLALGAAVMLI